MNLPLPYQDDGEAPLENWAMMQCMLMQLTLANPERWGAYCARFYADFDTGPDSWLADVREKALAWLDECEFALAARQLQLSEVPA